MLVLTTPLVSTVYSHEIKKIIIDLEANLITVTVSDLDVDDEELDRRDLFLDIYDDLDIILTPSTWPETNPTGEEMYDLIKEFIFLGLQDKPGLNGLGEGDIV